MARGWVSTRSFATKLRPPKRFAEPGSTCTVVTPLPDPPDPTYPPTSSAAIATDLTTAELSCGGTTLGIPVDRFEVPVESVEGRTYHLGRPLPTDIMPTGAYILAGDTGYEVESCTENTITVRDYPAIECEQLTLLNSLWFEARP